MKIVDYLMSCVDEAPLTLCKGCQQQPACERGGVDGSRLWCRQALQEAFEAML